MYIHDIQFSDRAKIYTKRNTHKLNLFFLIATVYFYAGERTASIVVQLFYYYPYIHPYIHI